jgi:lipoate-protein ligase A
VVFHLFDLAFSVIVPAHSRLFSMDTLQNYALINQAVLRAACAFLNKGEMDLITHEVGPRFLFCMAAPTKYDVVLEGKKVAGAAQRRTRRGFLHQGTIALVMPSSAFLEAVLPVGSPVQEAILRSSYPLLGKSASEELLRGAKRELGHLLTTQLTQLPLPFSRSYEKDSHCSYT